MFPLTLAKFEGNYFDPFDENRKRMIVRLYKFNGYDIVCRVKLYSIRKYDDILEYF